VPVDHASVAGAGAPAPGDGDVEGQRVADEDGLEVAPVGVEQPDHRPVDDVQVVQGAEEPGQAVGPVHQPLTELGAGGVVGVDVDGGLVAGDLRELQEGLLGDLVRRALEGLAHPEVLEVHVARLGRAGGCRHAVSSCLNVPPHASAFV
jgi:hypothetical protein